MDTKEKQERQLRRKAMRLLQQGLKPRTILARISRSRAWLWKWQQRFAQAGRAGLRSQSRRPATSPQRYAPRVRRLVIRLRHQLEQRREGWIGAGAIRAEIAAQRLLRKIPATATINRWLKADDCFPKPRQTPPACLPQPTGTARYLKGGARVFAFHTLDAHTRAIKQSICANKRFAAARQHVLEAWQRLGLPDGLQIDHDAAFNGNKAPHVVSEFVRLCLSLGVEPIFIPEQEAVRNGDIEGVHSMWGRGWWRRRRFHGLAQAQRSTPRFEVWYAQQYEQAETDPAHVPWPLPRRLTAAQVHSLPAELPITAGRIHFVRLVTPEGTIRLLNEGWHVHKRLAGHYVWATIVTHEQQLCIYHRPSAAQPVRLVKRYAYPLPESVVPLRTEFRRPYRRRKMLTML